MYLSFIRIVLQPLRCYICTCRCSCAQNRSLSLSPAAEQISVSSPHPFAQSDPCKRWTRVRRWGWWWWWWWWWWWSQWWWWRWKMMKENPSSRRTLVFWQQAEVECDDDFKGDYVILVTWDSFHVSWEIFALVIFNHDWCDQYRGSFKTLSNQRYPTSVTFLIRCRCHTRSHDLKIPIGSNWFLSQPNILRDVYWQSLCHACFQCLQYCRSEMAF